VRHQADGQDLVPHVHDLPRHGRSHHRGTRRAQARARLRVRVDGRPQARRVPPHARLPRACRRRSGEDEMTPPGGDAPEGGWKSLKVAELQEELEARGLPKSGKKAELVARLEEDDQGGAEAEAPEADAPEAEV